MKTQLKINPITVNFLDKGLQKVLLPFRYFQHVMFISSFSIEYNCIRPHRISYYILSFIGVLVFICFYLSNFVSTDFDEVNSFFLSIFIKVNGILVVVPLVFFYILNIIQRKDHVRLILEIQKAFRLINFKQYTKPATRNWLSILRHSVGFIFSVALTRNLIMAIYFYTLLYFDVILTYGASIIALIRDGIITWTSKVEHYSQLCFELEEEKYNDKFKNLFQAYIHLMKAFDIFKKMFKFVAVFQTLDTLFHSLLYLQAIFEVIKSEVKQIGSSDVRSVETVTILWTIKNLTFVTMFSLYCERFYMSLSEVDAVCSRLLRLQSSVEVKKLCKNVQRLNRAAVHKMTACRIFTIDGRLPLRFISLVLEYTFILLQFALVFLKNKTFEL